MGIYFPLTDFNIISGHLEGFRLSLCHGVIKGTNIEGDLTALEPSAVL
jgi:hypothetical protein